MNKLFIIFILFSFNASSQKFKGINPGLDTLAISNNIKSRIETTYEINGNQWDTIWKIRYDYSQNGFLLRYEETELLFWDKVWELGYNYIEFKYNENGYLIDKKEHWGGPVNVASTPDSNQTTTKKIFDINGYLNKEIVIQSTWWDESENFTDTTITIYNSNGSIAEIERPQFNTKIIYKYAPNGILIRIEYFQANEIYIFKEVEYEYYQ
jgi:hypothetical protein